MMSRLVIHTLYRDYAIGNVTHVVDHGRRDSIRWLTGRQHKKREDQQER